MAPTSRGPSAISCLVVWFSGLSSLPFLSPLFLSSSFFRFASHVLSSSFARVCVLPFTVCRIVEWLCVERNVPVPHQRFVFVMADTTCCRDSSGYRDTRWIIYYDSPFNVGRILSYTIIIFCFFFSFFIFRTSTCLPLTFLLIVPILLSPSILDLIDWSRFLYYFQQILTTGIIIFWRYQFVLMDTPLSLFSYR